MRRILPCLLLCACLLPACSTRQLVLGGVADALAAQGQSPEDGLQTT